MFKTTDNRLSASSSAVLASENFLLPVTLHSVSKTSQEALDALALAFEEVKGFVARLEKSVPGIALVPFEESVSPRMSRVAVLLQGKEFRVHLTFVLKCPVANESDFWGRIRLLSAVYDRFADLAAGFHERKGIELHLGEARLDPQHDDVERTQTPRKPA